MTHDWHGFQLSRSFLTYVGGRSNGYLLILIDTICQFLRIGHTMLFTSLFKPQRLSVLASVHVSGICSSIHMYFYMVRHQTAATARMSRRRRDFQSTLLFQPSDLSILPCIVWHLFVTLQQFITLIASETHQCAATGRTFSQSGEVLQYVNISIHTFSSFILVASQNMWDETNGIITAIAKKIHTPIQNRNNWFYQLQNQLIDGKHI